MRYKYLWCITLMWYSAVTMTLPSSPVECSTAHWLTSIRWELTFLPFLFQLTLGLGSPVAWHTKETTPPETPIWSTGTLVNRGGARERGRRGREEKQRKGISTSHKTKPTPPSSCNPPSVSYPVCVPHAHTHCSLQRREVLDKWGRRIVWALERLKINR